VGGQNLFLLRQPHRPRARPRHAPAPHCSPQIPVSCFSSRKLNVGLETRLLRGLDNAKSRCMGAESTTDKQTHLINPHECVLALSTPLFTRFSRRYQRRPWLRFRDSADCQRDRLTRARAATPKHETGADGCDDPRGAGRHGGDAGGGGPYHSVAALAARQGTKNSVSTTKNTQALGPPHLPIRAIATSRPTTSQHCHSTHPHA